MAMSQAPADSSDVERAASIRCILSDVDGVLTDGRIVYDDQLHETKFFHARDGLGIKLWMRSGRSFGILTARSGPIVAHRGGELGIETILQGYEDKWPAAEQMIRDFGCTPESTCYIGDDLPDVAVMKRVGLAVAPADAAQDVLCVADWVMTKTGGHGAVREMIERLLRAQQGWEEHVPD